MTFPIGSTKINVFPEKYLLPGDAMNTFRNTDIRWLTAALFWGSLWGAAEATAGHILHLLRIPGLAGMVMFPLGVYFMAKAFKASGKIKIIGLSALFASAIKLIDLAAPLSSPEAVINPALAILCEALAVMGVLFLFKKEFTLPSLPVFSGAAFGWRIFFLGLVAVHQFLIGSSGIWDTGGVPLLRFMGLDPLVNVILLTFIFHRFNSRAAVSEKTFLYRFPAFAPLVFLAALFLEWFI